MEATKIILLINDDARLLEGRYEENGKTELFKTMDPTIKIDDLVVVESGTRWGFTVVKIISDDAEIDFDSDTKVRWIHSKVDRRAFDKILAQEAKAISAVRAADRNRRRNELRDAMFSHDELKALPMAKTDDLTE